MKRNNLIPFPERDPSDAQSKRFRPLESGPHLSIDQVDIRIARTRVEMLGAFELIQRRYLEAGLSQNSALTLRVQPYHLWGETQVFVAVFRNKVIGTVSMVRDGNRMGIPMESTYPIEVNRLRMRGGGLGEICSLAVDPPAHLSSRDLFANLTRLMTFFARHVDLECFLAVVHPRHAKFYRMAMGFEAIGGSTPYQQVGGQPGVPILCRLNDRRSFHPRWQRHYFEGNYSSSELEPHKMCPVDRHFFERFLLESHADIDRRAA